MKTDQLQINARYNAENEQRKVALETEIKKLRDKSDKDFEKVTKKRDADLEDVKRKYDNMLADSLKDEKREVSKDQQKIYNIERGIKEDEGKVKIEEGKIALFAAQKKNINEIKPMFEKMLAMPYGVMKEASKVCQAIDELNAKMKSTSAAWKHPKEVMDSIKAAGGKNGPYHGMWQEFTTDVNKRVEEIKNKNFNLTCKQIEAEV